MVCGYTKHCSNLDSGSKQMPHRVSMARIKDFIWLKTGRIIYVSCYFTPNKPIAMFEKRQEKLEVTFRGNGQLIIAGDFNAKAQEWGEQETNQRGWHLLVITMRLGMAVANVGSTPTY